MSEYEYNSSTRYDWISNSYVKIESLGKKSIRLLANREGLLSLARQFECLANDIKETSICYDEDPGDLEEGSLYLEVIKIICEGRK